MILSCPRGVIEEYLEDLSAAVQWVVDIQDQDSNWPTKAPSPSRHDLLRPGPQANDLIQ